MAFMFKLEREDGTRADPPTLRTAAPDWHAGDTIPAGPGHEPARGRSPIRERS
jgi:hypothetical protein